MARVAASSLILVALTLLYIRDLPFLISARECSNIEIKNSVSSFRVLDGCSVVKGYLVIGLITTNVSPSNYSNLTFPDLKEITDFFMMHDVRGLTDMSKLFPNLVVIRGRRLFLSYALAVSNVPDLAAIEFRSLIAIQRGHVFIANSPKLCFLKKIDWDRLTLTSGENHIYPAEESKCNYAECKGCDYCWSNNFCQKFENVNLLNLTRGIAHCDSECLGGCNNGLNTGCNVCKGINDHGACVPKCPNNAYYSENYQRCYTKEECNQWRNYVFNDECIKRCPSGYNHSRKAGECIQCTTDCIKECYPEEPGKELNVISLGHAEALKNCQHLRGSMFISFRNKIEESDLIESFKSLKIVDGHIKVFYSSYLKSLKFLQNLEKVDGKPLENNTFGLVLYNNDNLEELWTPPAGKKMEFVNGGIYSYANRKLCNKILEDFGRNVVHNKEKDLIQINDQDVLCEPVRLNVNEVTSTHNSVNISWAKDQTAEEVEIIYREAKYNKGEESEFDDDICMRVHWQRELMFKTDIYRQNSSHYFYNISNLLPNTHYDYFVKTFGGKDYYSARSPVQRFLTKPDIPKAPKLLTYGKSFENITLMWNSRTELQEVLKYYILETFEQVDDLEGLDSRTYCEQPIVYNAESGVEDFDVCCQRKFDQLDDDEFIRDMENTFACTIDSKRNCHIMVRSGFRTNVSLIDAKLQNFTVKGLKHFTKYTFFLFACNDKDCGTYYMHSDRTKTIKDFDEVTNAYACRDETNLGYLVKFAEPPTPNGAVLHYIIQFKNTKLVKVPMPDKGNSYCIGRKEFENNGHKVLVNFPDSYVFNQFSVRVITTGGGALSKWFDIDVNVCTQKTKVSAFKVIVCVIAVIGLVFLVWFSCHRRWWTIERFHGWRREMDDRQELVPTLDTVAFRNSRESVF